MPETTASAPGASPRLPGRPRSLSEDAVVSAILEAGFIDLKAARVAEILAVNPATLYRFVSGTDEMVVLALDRLIRDADWPGVDGRDWRAYLSDTTWVVWGIVSDHPGLASASGSVLMRSRALLEFFARAVADLEGLGVPAPGSVLAVDMVLDLAIDSLRMREIMAATPGRPDLSREWEEGISPEVAATLRQAIDGDPAEWFAMKLRVALDGIGHELVGGSGA